MNRADLIDRLAFLHPRLLAQDADAAVRIIMDAMIDELTSGGRIEIRGFGSFSLNYHPPRMGRNPKTGVKVAVPAKYIPHFKPGLELRERVNYPKSCR